MSHTNPIVIKEEEEEEEEGEIEEEEGEVEEPQTKKAKTTEPPQQTLQQQQKQQQQQPRAIAPFPTLQEIYKNNSKPAIQFNATGQPIYMLPRDGKVLLLDIEGTTSSITFVKDVLFPYISNNVATYLKDMVEKSNDHACSLKELEELQHGLQEDLKQHGLEADYRQHQFKSAVKKEEDEPASVNDGHHWLIESITILVKYLVEKDVKAQHLKEFQGNMWKVGYEQGKLYGHVYDDVLPTFQWMAQQGVLVYIYSSGAIQAQKLLFQHSTNGNLIHFLSGHYDLTNAGPKREAESYQTIVAAFKAKNRHMEARDIIFVSDIEQEVQAAEKAGMQGVLSIRPGNAPCSEHALKRFAQVHSLLQLCGGEKRYWF